MVLKLAGNQGYRIGTGLGAFWGQLFVATLWILDHLQSMHFEGNKAVLLLFFIHNFVQVYMLTHCNQGSDSIQYIINMIIVCSMITVSNMITGCKNMQ